MIALSNAPNWFGRLLVSCCQWCLAVVAIRGLWFSKYGLANVLHCRLGLADGLSRNCFFWLLEASCCLRRLVKFLFLVAVCRSCCEVGILRFFWLGRNLFCFGRCLPWCPGCWASSALVAWFFWRFGCLLIEATLEVAVQTGKSSIKVAFQSAFLHFQLPDLLHAATSPHHRYFS